MYEREFLLGTAEAEEVAGLLLEWRAGGESRLGTDSI
jgi:hypothetical protein